VRLQVHQPKARISGWAPGEPNKIPDSLRPRIQLLSKKRASLVGSLPVAEKLVKWFEMNLANGEGVGGLLTCTQFRASRLARWHVGKLKARIQVPNKGHQGSGWPPRSQCNETIPLGNDLVLSISTRRAAAPPSAPAAGSVKQLDHGGVDGGAPHPLIERGRSIPAEHRKFKPRCERTASEEQVLDNSTSDVAGRRLLEQVGP
jgi:hypothetical protein